ncbi:hypothetical protein ABIA39_003672 [Nocardia sp. GAS34]|uniref:hypothetical protein n=1 Tax=unclassified Nocardia TaxID=2637762 RepID=UPI003D1E2959
MDRFSTCWVEPIGLTPERAHSIMQMHLDCHTDECPRRRAAVRTLIQSGHLVPDSSRVH